MHLRLALQFGHVLHERPTVQADSATERVIRIEHGSKSEWQYRGAFEAFTHHVCMLEKRLLPEVTRRDIFAHQHGKIAAGVRKYLCVSNAFETFYGNGTTCADTTLDCLLLNDTVCVPCHLGSFSYRKNVLGPALIVLNKRAEL